MAVAVNRDRSSARVQAQFMYAYNFYGGRFQLTGWVFQEGFTLAHCHTADQGVTPSYACWATAFHNIKSYGPEGRHRSAISKSGDGFNLIFTAHSYQSCFKLMQPWIAIYNNVYLRSEVWRKRNSRASVPDQKPSLKQCQCHRY